MYHRIRPHLPQFFRYLMSGGTAAASEIGSFQLMLMAGIDYRVGAFLSGCIGLLTAFVLHKFFVFKKREGTGKHVMRYIVLQLFNLVAQTLIVIVLVEFAGAPELLAKVLGIGATVSWNFFLYKFFVYVWEASRQRAYPDA